MKFFSIWFFFIMFPKCFKIPTKKRHFTTQTNFPHHKTILKNFWFVFKIRMTEPSIPDKIIIQSAHYEYLKILSLFSLANSKQVINFLIIPDFHKTFRRVKIEGQSRCWWIDWEKFRTFRWLNGRADGKSEYCVSWCSHD